MSNDMDTDDTFLSEQETETGTETNIPSDEELVMVHALSIPYLLCCGAIGLVLSVLLDDTDTA